MTREYKHMGPIANWRIAEWERIYSPLNVTGELDKMEQWLEANPRRRKKNYYRFIVNWLNKNHAQVTTTQAVARVQARAGEQTERIGCWVDGKICTD